ncbi:MAG: endonuclease/exonuclease/phosphatase family protein [Anaerolineae bacterium]
MLSLGTWFGLQELRVFIPSLAHTLGQWAPLTFIALYGLATLGLVWLTPLIWRGMGTFGAWTFTAGGLALLRLLEQLNGHPSLDLVLSTVSVFCFAAMTVVAAQHDLITGRGPRGMVLWPWALGIGLLLDTASRALLLTVDLPWRQDWLGHGVSAVLAGLALWLLVEWVRRWRGPQAHEVGDPSLISAFPWVGVPIFLALQVTCFGQVPLLAELGDLSFPWAAGWVICGNLVALSLAWVLLSRFGMDGKDWPVTLLAGGALVLTLSGIWRRGWLTPFLWLAGQAVAFLLVVLCLASPALSPSPRPGRWRGTLALFLGWVAFVCLLFGYEVYDARWALSVAGVGLTLGALWALRVTLPGQTLRVLRRRLWELAGLVSGVALTLLVVGGTSLSLGSPPAALPVELDTLRVMTYNVHRGFNADGALDLEGIARTIEAARPSVLSLNEVSRGRVMDGGVDLLLWLGRRLGMRYEFGPNVGGVYGNALLSRYPIVGVRNYPFQTFHSERRGCLATAVQVGERQVLFLATHLDHEEGAAPERAEQIREVLALWGKRQPAILLGDLNAEPGAPELSFLQPSGWQDAAAALTEKPAATFPAAMPVRRIDYIFLTADLEPLEVQVPTSLASDHRPVVAVVRFR